MKIPALCLATAFVMLSAAPSWSATMSEADCTSWFAMVDKNADGSLGQDENQPFMTKFTESSMTTKDATIVSKQEFMDACQKGTFEGIPQQ